MEQSSEAAVPSAMDTTPTPTTSTPPSLGGPALGGVKQYNAQDLADFPGEKVEFKVIFKKKKYDITFPTDETVGCLKAYLQSVIDIPPAMMKVMVKGLAKDEMTLRKLGVSKGTKMMVVGSTLNDVLEVSTKPTASQLRELETPEATDHKSSRDKIHKKVLDKGKPDD
eukprot:snap_masked-scaffold1635_size32709-processed-gene-0.4 protein:Tk07224 transcript:snap_masked-scaffold1635_size32709-processed-gene-0.4-mRNA-1 annotation:"ubiquitin domain-containing protein ubfd1"